MIDSRMNQRLKENWDRVKHEVRQAALDSHRDPDDVEIVGVSKYVDAETTLALVHAGCHALGESRPQQLWEKAEALALGMEVRWHLIGHLQRNKIRRTLRHHPVVHSVDSERLLVSIASEAVAQNQRVTVLLEVNISGDAAKTGFSPLELSRVLGRLPTHGVHVDGLMAMAGWGTERDDARRQFSQTRQLRDELAKQSGIPLATLSMGMSNDFVEAISEGATMVRIGSRLFDGLLPT